MPTPIDPDTYARAQEILARASVLGRDPVEALHDAGMILTPAVDKRIRLQAMNYLILRVEEFRPAEFLRRKQSTHADIYRDILQFLHEHVSWWEKEQ